MKRTIVAATAITLLLVGVNAASAKPKKAVAGSWSVGILAQGDLASKLKASAVWCMWNKDGKVIVHVNLKNTSIEHVTATIKPKYTIKNGSAHGDGFSSADDYGFDGGEFRSLWIEEDPKGTPDGSPISKCTPYLFLIKSG